MKFIDLCCGIGSFHYSLNKLGHQCVYACDINDDVRKTYKENYNIMPEKDIKKIDINSIPNFDILTCGIPCQSFSQVGKQKGVHDDRYLFPYITKIIDKHKPKYIIFENVPALVSNNGGATFKTIIDEFNKNYVVSWKILKCSDYGIPQIRKRLFIFCIRNDLNEKKYIKKMLKIDKYKKNVKLKDYLGKNFIKDYAYTLRVGGRGSDINDKHNWDGYLVDNKIYRLSIEDCLKLQGFNGDFKLFGSTGSKYKMCGNSIPTNLTYYIGKRINKYLS